MGLYYTGKGDRGQSFVGDIKIDKTSIEIEAIGELDELNSLIGLVRAEKLNKEFEDIFMAVQQDLFIVQANVANLMFKGRYGETPFPKTKIEDIEAMINNFESEVGPERKFVISGGNKTSAWLDLARAVSRRTERSILKFNKIYALSPEILGYMNRLSSLLFAMARVEAKRSGDKEAHPSYL